MFCPHCGKEVQPQAVVCVSCGAAVSGAPAGAAGAANAVPGAAPQTGTDWLTTLLLCFFLGAFGVHRFYSGSTGIGIVQLLTLGGCGVWTFVDFIMIIVGSFRDGAGRPLVKR